MIALDTSAIVAIALGEDEEEAFSRVIAMRGAYVGAPTLVEARLVLASRLEGGAEGFMDEFLGQPVIRPVAFEVGMYAIAATAFARFGKGMGHPAKLNFGDCMAYAVAKAYDAPLLYKGGDFGLTDIKPALP